MKIGSFYESKNYCWFLYPSKDIAVVAASGNTPAARGNFAGAQFSSAWSKKLNCKVSFIEEKGTFCLLEQEDKFIKVLTNNGEIGWIVLADWCKEDIAEAKAE
jgi:hypothetical protein